MPRLTTPSEPDGQTGQSAESQSQMIQSDAGRNALARRIVAGGYSWEQTGKWLAKQSELYGKDYADDMAVRIGIEKALSVQAHTGRRFAI